MREILFSCQTRSFPATSAALGIGERVGLGGAPGGVGVGEIFHFPVKSDHFLPHLPHSALARGLVREASLGVSGLARFSIFLPNPVISCHICRFLRWREGWFGRRLWWCRGWRDFPFSCQTRSFPATSGLVRRISPLTGEDGFGSGSSNNSASDAVGARPVFRLHSSPRFIGR